MYDYKYAHMLRKSQTLVTFPINYIKREGGRPLKKPLRILKNQVVNTILMVALTVPLLVVAITLEHKPTLSFEGARIQVVEDANGETSVQLLFDVCVRYTPMTDGVQFALNYNTKYLVASNYVTNEPIADMTASKPAFQMAPGLYRIDTNDDGIADTDFDPLEYGDPNRYIVDAVYGTIYMYLYADRTIDVEAQSGEGLTRVRTGESETPEYYNVFNADERLVLGTMSFRVVDPDLMPEITKRFDNLNDLLFEQNHAKDVTDAAATDNDRLIYFDSKGTGDEGRGPWGIGVCEPRPDSGMDYAHKTINDYEPSGTNSSMAQAAFTYHFPKTIIKARAAEAELTINAYQAYTDGRVSDVDAALQKYSPAITVTYSDGSEGNFIMPWNRTGAAVDGLPWTSTVVTNRNVDPNKVSVDVVTDTATQVLYDPTASEYKTTDKPNQNYLVEKDFCYEEADLKGTVQKKTFPVPIKVNLTVTPITLLDVTANDLHRSYLLNDNLVSGLTAVQSAGDLKLPNQARLVTDVPAGGNTLTMDIPGWSHPQTYAVDGGGTETRYWPSDNTTPGTGTGIEIVNLWKDTAADETTGTYLHWPTAADLTAANKWKTVENGTYLGANRAGVYTFKMAESYGGAPTDFTKPAIQAAYPWLTIPEEHYAIEDATRTIVWNDDPGKTDPKLADINNYEVTWESTVTAANSQPELTLRVKKKNDRSQIENLPKDSIFRIKLPDGVELGIGALKDVTPDLPDWFADDGSYTRVPVTNLGDYSDMRGFDLVTNPGDPTDGSYGDERESLRRYINLGGWFYVAVKEMDTDNAAAETLWSDFIPVYVPPRLNEYTESKVYNFIGDNAGLYPWPGGVSTTVILPPGTYNPVEINAGKTAIEPVYDPVGSTTRKVERYGVSTIYDGATGAQPGELHTFTVVSPWTTSGPETIDGHDVVTYGANHFLDGATYPAFGLVYNLMTDRKVNPINYLPNAYTATIRTEKEEPRELREKLVLEYVSTSGGAASYNTDGTNVTNVIFEPRTQGYTLRQDYTLVLRNLGDVDISGISIDTLNDLAGNSVYDKSKDSNPAGGHFEILKPPASFLPAGEETTFVISYVYNLEAEGSTPVDYRDKIFITSNSHHTLPAGPTTAGGDYLLDFDAQFQVTASSIHRVTVRVIPAEGKDQDGNIISMPFGTAGVIVGESSDGSGGTIMNTAAGPTAFTKDNRVYILVSPTDEYTRFDVTAVDSTGRPLTISKYNGTADVPEGHEVYVFIMPDYDTTVTVIFEEPVSSKLRLGDLRVYASESENNHYPNTETVDSGRSKWDSTKDQYEQKIWQKSFTDSERNTAAGYTQDDGKDLYLMTQGTAYKPDFDSQVNQYLVVLPADADWSQVEADLRKVEYIFNTANGDPITNQPLTGIVVQMTLYETKDVFEMLDINSSTNTDIYPRTYNSTAYPGWHTGETNGPTTHTSIPFLSPDPGDSKYVRVRLSYTEGGVTVYRAYYIELHRAPAQVDAQLNYGNSPYGMIMNDPAITAKNGAKTAFVNNNYTFDGMSTALTPSVVKDNGLTSLHYWLETWAAPTETWADPNADWATTNAVYDADTGMSQTLYEQVHDPNVNLDLNDYAFFAIMGEAFRDPGIARATDSSGRPVDLTKAILSLTAYTLDGTVDKDVPGAQLERFTLPSDPDDLKGRTVTFGFQDILDHTPAASGDTVTDNWAQWYVTKDGELTHEAAGNTLLELRPGRYQLAYTFPDFNFIPADPANNVEESGDYLTVTRDFVVLAPVGDVNADLTVSTGVSQSDEALLEGRISPNAGYPALGYMTYATDAIFKLRTCDVNNDRNINNIDANTIKEGTAVEQFYLPINYKPAGTPAPGPSASPAPSPTASTTP